jgi:hypothetical protein
MSDQKPDTPQDGDVTQTVAAPETQHLEPHPPPAAAWTTWVPESAARHDSAGAPSTAPTPSTEDPEPTSWSPAQGGSPWLPPPLPPAMPAPTSTPSSTPSSAPSPAAAPAPPASPRPQVTYLPPPSGPNWGLVVVGLVFGLVGAGVVANQVSGFQVSSLTELGPSVLVVAGLACALLGLVGIVTRRRRG